MKCFSHATSAWFATDISLAKKNPFRLYPDSVGAWRPLRESSAFSLTEVVIAMGVAAVAFTTIIGLFPLGLNMSRESYEASQAALIAQTILSDLKDATSTSSNSFAGYNAPKLIQIRGQTHNFTTANYAVIELNNNTRQTFYLAYDLQPRSDSTASPILPRPFTNSFSLPDWYSTGLPGASLIVRVIVEKTAVADPNSASNPQKVEVSVETPGTSSLTNRVQCVFTGVINQS
jgi:hypothetical protein